MQKSSFGEGNLSFFMPFFSRADNYEVAKYNDEIEKISSLEPLGQFHQNLAKVTLGKEDLSLFIFMHGGHD